MNYPKPKRRSKWRSPLDEDLILSWADAHFARHGAWPKRTSGPVDGQPGESWCAINSALLNGYRGLLLGSSLALLLEERRGVRRLRDLPPLTVDQILQWADQFLELHGRYPLASDGRIEWATGETWSSVDRDLKSGYRGLPGTSSLAKILEEERGRRNLSTVPDLSVEQILEWMDEHHGRAGEWPTAESGAVVADPSEQWSAVHAALRNGLRGLPGKSGLARLAITHRGRIDQQVYAPLSRAIVAEWIEAYSVKHARFPTSHSGDIEDAPGENWGILDRALRVGYRGLPGGQSLWQLREELVAEQKVPELSRRRQGAPPLSIEQIAGWMRAYAARHGRYPSNSSGPIEGAPGDTWPGVHQALMRGYRSLPGGQSLAKLRQELIETGKLPALNDAPSESERNTK